MGLHQAARTFSRAINLPENCHSAAPAGLLMAGKPNTESQLSSILNSDDSFSVLSSPNPASKMISSGNRESLHPRTVANGR
jgi:hypothetical protein